MGMGWRGAGRRKQPGRIGQRVQMRVSGRQSVGRAASRSVNRGGAEE